MRYLFFSCLMIVLASIAVSYAHQVPAPPPPPNGDRPTDLIAIDLGIPEHVFIDCFSGVSPEPTHKPSGGQQRDNKAILLPCLQEKNPSITNERLDSVMDKYRPEGLMQQLQH